MDEERSDLRDLCRLPCPSCGLTLGLFEVFDGVSSCVAGTGWLRFQCPGCGAASLVALDGEQVAIGTCGDPSGRLFAPRARARQRGLGVQRAPEGIVLSLFHRRWFVGPRETGGTDSSAP